MAPSEREPQMPTRDVLRLARAVVELDPSSRLKASLDLAEELAGELAVWLDELRREHRHELRGQHRHF